MDYFVGNAQVQLWEAELAAGPPQARRLELLELLTWHLRQRDGPRALALAAQARDLVAAAAPEGKHQVLLTRLLLAEAEIALFCGEPASVHAAIEQVEQRLQYWPESLTRIDLSILLAWSALLEGQAQQSHHCWTEVMDLARQVQEPVRTGMAEMELYLAATYRDPNEGRSLHTAFQASAAVLHPAIQATRGLEWQGTLAAQASAYGRAATLRFQAFDAAIELGQINWAIAAASNAADALNSLNEYALALQWVERAIDLARARGWPLALAHGLSQMGETLRRLGRLDAAAECLQESRQLLSGFAPQRRHLIANKYRADLYLDQAQPELALAGFIELEQGAVLQQFPDLLVHAHRGQAQALARLGRAEQAHRQAQEALRLAQQTRHVLRQVECLRALAGLHAQCPQLPAPPELRAASASLHYLLQALELVHSIEGYLVPGELWEELAEAHARLGDTAQAYSLARQAAATRQKAQNEGANQRLTVMQVMHQTDRARAEAEHQRSLAYSQAQRADALERSRATLERLSAMGLDITSNLERHAVLLALARHMDGLLGLDALIFGQANADGKNLSLLRVTPAGQLSSGPDVALGDSQSALARAASDCEASGLCAPLMVGERMLGVLALEPHGRIELSEGEQLLFRSLCAYATIALDNAQTHQRLRDVQAQMVQQEKLAALGHLVAGVAHELNTPIGNCLLAASTLQQSTQALAQQVQAQALKRAELQRYLDSTSLSSDLLIRGLHTAAELVQRFKQIAVDPRSEALQEFELLPLCDLLAREQRADFEAAGIALHLQVPAGLRLKSYPGALQQVLAQLLNNALLHGFATGGSSGGGRVLLKAQALGQDQGQGQESLQLQVIDDGKGIAAEHLDRIFDPFFSTRFGQGGSGLGLHICHNLVTVLLQGSIRVTSEAGTGCCFEITLPLQLLT